MRVLFVFLVIAFTTVAAEPLKDFIELDDGLDIDKIGNISDDYIRLTLTNPNYDTANSIMTAVDYWLGPGMVRVESNESILIQAPRMSTQRITFISALLNLEVEGEVPQ